MLSEKEVEEVQKVINILKEIRQWQTKNPYSITKMQWLAEKLLEINNEASKYLEELQEIAKLRDKIAEYIEHKEELQLKIDQLEGKA